jgi:hypothetical protein
VKIKGIEEVAVSIKEEIYAIMERGEEYIRQGKLDLVDLAGSENVGRPGAQNQRTRVLERSPRIFFR